MKELTKKQQGVLALCLIMMAIGSAALILFKDTIFTTEFVVTYPDGCQEIYHNTELISEKCDYEEPVPKLPSMDWEHLGINPVLLENKTDETFINETNATVIENETTIKEIDFYKIAEIYCTGGVISKAEEDIVFNEATGTYWIEFMPDEGVLKGCNPACVVSIQDMTAEINHRCSGMLEPTLTPINKT